MGIILYRDASITIFQSELFQTNSTVVKTEDVILVFDPGWLPGEVSSIKHYVDSIKGNLPVYLIFTHSDYDHIIGYKAFDADKVIASEAFSNNPDKSKIIQQILEFDDQYYIKRSYPIVYPEVDFQVYKDGVQYRIGNTKMTFYLTPGHTADSMMIIVWQLGLCIAGDYLSNVEFPYIYSSSIDYITSLEKLPSIHDRNWFTKLVPGHGAPALNMNEWLKRRTDGLSYLYMARESIATQQPFDESWLWTKYDFPISQSAFHKANMELMQKEFDQGLWTWDAQLMAEILQQGNLNEESL